MERINILDTPMDAIMKIADGNPGAVTAISECMSQVTSIDTDTALGAFGFVLNLDSFGIYGSDVWILYKDLCKCEPLKMITVLRAIQMGLMPLTEIKSAIGDSFNAEIDHEAILASVKEVLPNFAKQQ